MGVGLAVRVNVGVNVSVGTTVGVDDGCGVGLSTITVGWGVALRVGAGSLWHAARAADRIMTNMMRKSERFIVAHNIMKFGEIPPYEV